MNSPLVSVSVYYDWEWKSRVHNQNDSCTFVYIKYKINLIKSSKCLVDFRNLIIPMWTFQMLCNLNLSCQRIDHNMHLVKKKVMLYQPVWNG